MGDKKLIYYIFTLTVLAIATIGYFFSYPAIKNIDSIKNNLSSNKSELSYLEEKEDQLKKLEKEYDKYKDEIEESLKLFPRMGKIL